jgi:predicted MFS family arabinose efflux permease
MSEAPDTRQPLDGQRSTLRGAGRAGARTPAVLLIAASGILLLTMGVRQSLGLFLLPIVTATGVSLVSVSFALAIGQFVWGAAQPLFGAVADHYGAYRVLIWGAVLLAAGGALATRSSSGFGFTMTLGVLLSAGTAAGSFAILIGVTSRSLSPAARSLAAGIINAGGSLGQLLFAPVVQLVIKGTGWRTGMLGISAAALLTVPLALLFRGHSTGDDAGSPAAASDSAVGSPAAKASTAGAPTVGASAVGAPAASSMGLREQLRVALRDPSYLCLNAGFFTCGFHIAFLVTHLPGNLQLCGLSATVAANSLALIGAFNVLGSLFVGWLGRRYRMKSILAWLYASRAAVVVCYLWMPKTAFNVYLIAGALGLSWLATVPPTAGIVGKLFGTRYLTTLFGLTLLTHQIGGFLGAWLGGVAMARLGSYDWVWYADIALALAAALIDLPIKEAVPREAMVSAPA